MWPFRRRSPDEISLSDLQRLAESSPTKKYVNLLVLELARSGENAACTLGGADSLPVVPLWQEKLPPFEKVRNRLKVMAGIDPVMHPAPVKGRIEIWIGGRRCYIHAEFDDRPEYSRVYLRLEWLEPPRASQPMSDPTSA